MALRVRVRRAESYRHIERPRLARRVTVLAPTPRTHASRPPPWYGARRRSRYDPWSASTASAADSAYRASYVLIAEEAYLACIADREHWRITGGGVCQRCAPEGSGLRMETPSSGVDMRTIRKLVSPYSTWTADEVSSGGTAGPRWRGTAHFGIYAISAKLSNTTFKLKLHLNHTASLTRYAVASLATTSGRASRARCLGEEAPLHGLHVYDTT